MATIGQPLTAPESGWKRYDDTNSALKYTGTWVSGTSSGWYNSTYHEGSNSSSQVSFNFIGTQLRIISTLDTSANRSSDISISIDGVVSTYSEVSTSAQKQILTFEKTGLSQGTHTVVINGGTGGTYRVTLDAVDIDATGRLLHPDEVTDLNNLVIGKRIRAHYIASSGVFGTFSGLGQETYKDGINDFIPVSSSATPNGDFYILYVGDDFLGRKILVADRNVQQSISWDTLNTAGVASGSGFPSNYVWDLSAGYTLPVINTIQIANDLTINTKIFVKSLPASGKSQIYVMASAGESLATNNLYALSVDSTGKLYLSHEYSSGGTNIDITTTATIQANTITDITLARSSSALKYTIYINGVFQGDYSYSNNPQMAASGNTQALNIGKDISNGSNSALNMVLYNMSIENSYVDQASYATYSSTKYNDGKLFNLNPLNTPYNGFTVRLLTGGTTSSDTDDEWDNFIVKSTLGGTITAGDNNVWNWNGLTSWTSTVASTNTNRVYRGSNAANGYGGGTSSGSTTTVGFRPVILVETLAVNKYLFQDGTDIKKYVSGSWSVVGQAPVTQSMFDTDGMISLSEIDKAAIGSLVSNQPKLLVWASGKALTIGTLTAVPKGQVVSQSGDMTLPVAGVSGFALTSNLAGSGMVKLAASADSGVTWNVFSGSSWSGVTPDASNLKASGMTPSVFNAITKDQWASMIGSSSKIRFVYYLEQASASDAASVDAIAFTSNPVALNTPTVDSIKVSYEDLTIEGRMQDLEQLNAVNMAKLQFKSNSLLQSDKYELHDLVVDTFETSTSVESTQAVYSTTNKEYAYNTATAAPAVQEVILPAEEMPAYRKKFILNVDHAGSVSYEYSLDSGSTWTALVPFTLIDLTGKTGTNLKVKAKLLDSTAKLRGIAFSWA